MENNPPLTPLEILEERRLWRRWLCWFVKHNARFNPQRICALVTDYLAWTNFLTVAGFLENLTQLLKALTLIPKFCNGLAGVSLTDRLPAPAIN